MNKNNAFLDAGIDSLFGDTGNPNEYEIMVTLDDIEIYAQDREEFENDENELADLGRSLRKIQLQNIVICQNSEGRVKPYRLVAGERRTRAARLEGLQQLRARVIDITEDEVEDLQFIENIHHKNLTQIEEAKKIQRDFDKLGSIEAVLKKYDKSRAWLSKTLSLLNLPEQAKRLVTENVSADIEVINTVKTIEKIDPAKAKELVDDLKNTRGKSNARDKVAAIKDEVKPSKKSKNEEKPQKWLEEQRKRREGQGDGVFADAKIVDFTTVTGTEINTVVFLLLDIAYNSIFIRGDSPETILDAMNGTDRDLIDNWLRSFYDAGGNAKDTGRAVLQGLRDNQFSSDRRGAFALVAFLHGVDNAKYSLLNIFVDVKQ
jgi:ParB family chromosome partitioning protein